MSEVFRLTVRNVSHSSHQGATNMWIIDVVIASITVGILFSLLRTIWQE